MRAVLLMLLICLTAVITGSSFPREQAPDGKKLFEQLCASCHHPTKQYTAWPFQQIRRCYTLAQITTFLHNPVKFMVTDSLMQVNKRYSGSFMNVAFPRITEQEVKAILDYVDSFPYDPRSAAYQHRQLMASQKDSIWRARQTDIHNE